MSVCPANIGLFFEKIAIFVPVNRKHHVRTPCRTAPPPNDRRIHRSGTPRGTERRVPQVLRDGQRPLVHPLGSAGRGQDHPRADRRHAARTSLLHPLGRDVGREGGARSDRVGPQEPFLRPAAPVPVHRRDTPLQQVAAGLAAGGRRTGCRDAHRRDDREPVVRGDLAAAEPLPGLHSPPDGGQGPANAARPGADRRRGTPGAGNRGPGDGRAVPFLGRRRTQAAQHPRHRHRRHRGQGHDHRPLCHGLPPAEHRPLRQERRAALRHHLGLHQVGPGQRSQRGDLPSRGCSPEARSRASSPGGS